MQKINRAPRIRLDPLKRLQLRIDGQSGDEAISLLNISSSGFATTRTAISEELLTADSLHGKLVGHEESFPVQFKVARKTSDVVGFQFIDPTGKTAKWIENFLTAELSALSMKLIPKEKLKAPSKAASGDEEQLYWYSGGNQCELYYTLRGKVVERFTLCFLGNYIRGGEHIKFQFGEQKGNRAAPSPHIAPRKGFPLREVEIPSRDFVDQSLQFLVNIVGLPEDHRASISALILRDLS